MNPLKHKKVDPVNRMKTCETIKRKIDFAILLFYIVIQYGPEHDRVWKRGEKRLQG